MRVVQALLLIIVFAYLASQSHHWTHFAAFLLTIAVPFAIVVGLVVGRRV